MRLFLGLNCLLLLFVSAFITGFAFCQDNHFNSLVEGSFWNYVSTVTLNMEAFEDEFEASLRDVMTTRGNVTVIEISPSTIKIEDRFTVQRKYYHSITGTEETDPVYKTVIYTIDRQTLTYSSIKEKKDDGSEVPMLEDAIGLPCRQFISPALKEGQKTHYTAYYWRGDIYSVTYDAFDFKQDKIPVISLSYTGLGHYDPDHNMNVTVNAIIQFEKSTGLKVSEYMKYEAADYKGKKQVVSTYEISSTSIFTPGKSQKPGLISQSPVPDSSSGKISEWVIVLILVVFITIVLFTFLFSRKKRNRSKSGVRYTRQLEYCYYCGTSMPVDGLYCKKCGKKQR